ncbi:hypothetical protein BXO88_16100 [Oribacterium sp. C9]|uniref:hypothetical protein n=1 Tax=Oribacterium sp. C9 TaxID=1943579 RepID=UPI00098F7089|nr:hypothetical protein [Oribacterium sp. C9]OON84673.1 hypothetical protein BXO88_16100 [Oribacterium sp. C9]
MATSSIFHNVIINDPEKADAFISAIEESISDPYIGPSIPKAKIESDSKKLSKLLNLWKSEAPN